LKGKATLKRNRASEKGQATLKRIRSSKKDRRIVNPSWGLKEDLQYFAGRFVTGNDNFLSPVFTEHTGLNGDDLKKHICTFLTEESGMTLANHTKVWEISHLIPRTAFNHKDPENVHRCWNLHNFRADLIETNKGMWHRIIPENALLAGEDCFPVEWNGHIPSQDKIDDFFVWCNTKWVEKTDWFDWSTGGAGSSSEHAQGSSS